MDCNHPKTVKANFKLCNQSPGHEGKFGGVGGVWTEVQSLN